MIKIWKKALKKMDVLDMALIKFSTAAFTLFVITIWPAAMEWVLTINPWYFLIASLIIGARTINRAYLK